MREYSINAQPAQYGVGEAPVVFCAQGLFVPEYGARMAPVQSASDVVSDFMVASDSGGLGWMVPEMCDHPSSRGVIF